MTIGRALALIAPFSYMWILRTSVGKNVTILDLGCDDGALMESIYDNTWSITGVDIFKSSVQKAKSLNIYREVIIGDIENVSKKLIAKKKKYDVVFFSQVIEHISKKKGERLLELIEKLSKNKIIIGTPHGFMIQPKMFLKNNKYQFHKSGWEIKEFEERGYVVHGIGIRFLWSETGLGRLENPYLVFISNILSYLCSPIAYYFPNTAAGILAVKILQK